MNGNSFILNKAISYIITLIVIVFFVRAISTFVDKSNTNDTSTIESSINSALMQCYSLEGAYPSDMYYLQEYGIWFDDDKYYYDYDFFDSGIMPMVSVVKKRK